MNIFSLLLFNVWCDSSVFGLGNTFLGGSQIGQGYANEETCMIKSSCKYYGIYSWARYLDAKT